MSISAGVIIKEKFQTRAIIALPPCFIFKGKWGGTEKAMPAGSKAEVTDEHFTGILIFCGLKPTLAENWRIFEYECCCSFISPQSFSIKWFVFEKEFDRGFAVGMEKGNKSPLFRGRFLRMLK